MITSNKTSKVEIDCLLQMDAMDRRKHSRPNHETKLQLTLEITGSRQSGSAEHLPFKSKRGTWQGVIMMLWRAFYWAAGKQPWLLVGLPLPGPTSSEDPWPKTVHQFKAPPKRQMKMLRGIIEKHSSSVGLCCPRWGRLKYGHWLPHSNKTRLFPNC